MERSWTCILTHMTRLFIFSLICIISGLVSSQNDSQLYSNRSGAIQRERPHVDTGRIAIFNLNADWWLSKRFDGMKSFNLTNAELQTIDKIFEKCLVANKMDTLHFHYKRQYVPFIDKAGQKKVWVNCFCSDFDSDFTDWRKSIVLVDDGGSCFFNVIINITGNSFSNFEVNGNA